MNGPVSVATLFTDIYRLCPRRDQSVIRVLHKLIMLLPEELMLRQQLCVTLWLAYLEMGRRKAQQGKYMVCVPWRSREWRGLVLAYVLVDMVRGRKDVRHPDIDLAACARGRWSDKKRQGEYVQILQELLLLIYSDMAYLQQVEREGRRLWSNFSLQSLDPAMDAIAALPRLLG